MLKGVRHHAGNFRETDMNMIWIVSVNNYRTNAMREKCTNCSGYTGEELGAWEKGRTSHRV